MTGHAGPLPAGDERHLKALEAAMWALCVIDPAMAERAIAAYHRSLADQGVRLVDASEVAEWLRASLTGPGITVVTPEPFTKAFLARFGGGGER